MTAGRDSQTATLLGNGKFLIAGGDNLNGALAGAEVYDPAAGAFSPAGNLNNARSNAAAALPSQGQVLLTGGVVLDTAELY